MKPRAVAKPGMKPLAALSEGSKGTFYNIQTLRGLAACMVVLYHASEGWSLFASGNYSHAWYPGAGGVDLFFVISGFVMAISAIGKGRGSKASLSFFKRRVIRVMPLYWLATTLLILKIRLGLVHGSALVHLSIKSALLSYLLIPYQPDASPLVGHAWTLSYEMFFYLCLAAALLTRKKIVTLISVFLSALVILGMFRTDHWPMVTVLFSPWLLEFLSGLWLGVAVKEGYRLNNRLSGSVGIGALTFLCVTPGATPMQHLIRGVCALGVVQAAVFLEPKLGGRMPRWALLIGDSSYSLYLIHLFFIVFFVSLLHRANLISVGRVDLRDELLTVVFCLVCSALLGIVIHKLVEYPMNRLLSGTGKPVQTEAATQAG